MNRRTFLLMSAATAAVTVAGCDDRDDAPADAIDVAPPDPVPELDESPATTRATAATTAPADDQTTAAALEPGVFDAGPVDAVAEGGPTDAHRDDGFFVVRRGGEVYALSAACTHRNCSVHAQDDGSFKCRCHGSLFAPDGAVTKGPAERDLARLGVKLDGRRHVLVNVNDPRGNPA